MLLLIVSTCVWISSASADTSVVVTSSGPIRGSLVEEDGISYYAYQGVPYAESPTGHLRFKPPVPKQPWSEEFDASKPGPVCPQAVGAITKDEMSEDCLRVNIFVPANRTQPLPVFVWVHGGAFRANSGNINIRFGPQLLLKRGIIQINVNYRLGALGYLSLETDEASGNAGLKDLLLALEWIKNNIETFGGSTITIAGQSSGAAMIHHMLLTEKSTGLFDRAMLSSGSATNYRFVSLYPREHALALVKDLGLQADDDDTILSNLRKADVFDIIDAQENLYKNMRNIMRPSFAPFVPCIEKDSNHSILSRHPIDIIKDGIPNHVPILAGINSVEGATMWPTLHKKSETFLKEQFALSIPGDIEYPFDSDQYKDLENSTKKFYFGKNNERWTQDKFYGLLSDTQYAHSVGSWINIYKERKDSEKLYYYLFNFDGELNWSKITYNISFPGAVHTDDIGYLFVNRVTKERLKNLDERTQKTLDNMLTFVGNFIKYGDPTPLGRSHIYWPKYDTTLGIYLIINDQPKHAFRGPFRKRFAFWTNVYKQYSEYLQNGGVRETRTPPPP